MSWNALASPPAYSAPLWVHNCVAAAAITASQPMLIDEDSHHCYGKGRGRTAVRVNPGRDGRAGNYIDGPLCTILRGSSNSAYDKSKRHTTADSEERVVPRELDGRLPGCCGVDPAGAVERDVSGKMKEVSEGGRRFGLTLIGGAKVEVAASADRQ